MFKKLFYAIAALMLSMGLAFAQVDVNKASQAELDGVKGIGPAISKQIVDERAKGGSYKDWSDLETRVKGIGAKNSAKMSEAGLRVGGQSKSGAPAAKVEKKETKSVKAASAPASAPAKADAKAAKKAKADANKKAKADEKAAKKAKADADKKSASAPAGKKASAPAASAAASK